MELIKNFLKYVLILAVVVVLAFSLMAGILFLFPNLSLFGFRYVSNHTENVIIAADSGVNKVNVETDGYDIVIKPNLTNGAVNNNLRIAIVNNYVGFVNNVYTTQVKDITTGKYLNIENFNENISCLNGEEYSVILKEPKGIVSKSNSQVLVFVPENAQNIVYNLKTNSGKIIFDTNNINENKSLSTGNIDISVNSARGSMSLKNARMSDGSNLTIKNYIGRVVVDNDKIGNVIINSNSGNFTFSNVGYEGFTGGNLTVTGNNPYVTVNKIYGTLTFNATTGFIKVNELLGDGMVSTENGIIRINKVMATLDSTNNSGETTINQIGEPGAVGKYIDIRSKSGVVNLGTDETGIYVLGTVDTTSGRVIVKNLYDENATINTIRGSVNVTFAKNEVEKNLTVSTISGKITLNDIYGNITASTQNSSKIIANFYKISSGVSSLITDGGDIEVNLPIATNDANKQYILNAKNKTNKLNINLGGFIQSSFEDEKDAQHYFNFEKSFPEESTTTNTINLQTNTGKISINKA